MGALVTLELPEESPLLDLPWIITFGPLGQDEDWEPVVCGPYERAHALRLAEAVVADEELMGVVEPLLPAVSADEVRGEIAAARTASEDEAVQADEADFFGDLAETADEELEAVEEAEAQAEPPAPPSEEELRAGFQRIAARLAGKQAG